MRDPPAYTGSGMALGATQHYPESDGGCRIRTRCQPCPDLWSRYSSVSLVLQPLPHSSAHAARMGTPCFGQHAGQAAC